MRRSPAGSSAFDRASVLLGLASLVFAGFVFGAQLPTEFDFVHIGATGAVVLFVSGTLAIAGGTTRRPALYAAAGVLLTVAALAQLAGTPLPWRSPVVSASGFSCSPALSVRSFAPTIPTKGKP